MPSVPRRFLPTLFANALPLFGITLLGWRVAEVLATYWLAMATSFLAYGGAALFAARPVVLEGREEFFLPGVGRNSDRDEKWEREPTTIELPGSLPPVYPRNARLVAATLFWGFGLLVVTPLVLAPAAVEGVLSLPLLATAGAMLASRLLDLRREFFEKGRYAEQSAHTVLETPGRLLGFAAIYLAVATVAGGVVLLIALALLAEFEVAAPDAGALFGAAMVAGNLLAEWGRFEAEHAAEPGRLGRYFLPEEPEG